MAKTTPLTLRECDLSQELLKECFDYNEDGYFIWKERPLHHFSNAGNQARFNTNWAGKRAGYFNKRTDSKREGFGYWKVRITLDGFQGMFRLHRLIFLYHKGFLPKIVDHKDNNSENNKISNLRSSNLVLNGCNRYLQPNGSSKYKGVHLNKVNKKWYAAIMYKGILYGCGSYENELDAAYAYNYIARLLNKDHFLINPIDSHTSSLNLPPRTRELLNIQGEF